MNNLHTSKGNAKFIRPALMVALIGLATPLFASNPTTGQLVIINGLANIVNGTVGDTASAVKVVVSDSTGPCSTTATVAYGGMVTVKWNAASTHSATVCTNISSVDIFALKTFTNTVQYDSTANSTPPAVATAATTFTAPTTPITNMTLIITGGASAASTGSATAWGIALGVKPIYDTNNASLITTGIMGGVGASGLKAESIMRRFAITPMKDASNEVAAQ